MDEKEVDKIEVWHGNFHDIKILCAAWREQRAEIERLKKALRLVKGYHAEHHTSDRPATD